MNQNNIGFLPTGANSEKKWNNQKFRVCLYQNGFQAEGGGVGGNIVGESNDKFGNNENGLGEYEPNSDKLVLDVCDEVDDDGDGNSNEWCW